MSSIFGIGMGQGKGQLSKEQVESMLVYSDSRGLLAAMLIEASDIIQVLAENCAENDAGWRDKDSSHYIEWARSVVYFNKRNEEEPMT